MLVGLVVLAITIIMGVGILVPGGITITIIQCGIRIKVQPGETIMPVIMAVVHGATLILQVVLVLHGVITTIIPVHGTEQILNGGIPTIQTQLEAHGVTIITTMVVDQLGEVTTTIIAALVLTNLIQHGEIIIMEEVVLGAIITIIVVQPGVTTTSITIIVDLLGVIATTIMVVTK